MMYNFNASSGVIELTNDDIELINQYESIFSIGNGRYGLRCSFEEKRPYENRGLFRIEGYSTVKNQVESLLILPDPVQVIIKLDDELFYPTKETVEKQKIYLNLKTREFCRDILWTSKNGNKYLLKFKRFFSFSNPNLLMQKIEITSFNTSVICEIKIGVDGYTSKNSIKYFDFMNKSVEMHRSMHSIFGLRDCTFNFVKYIQNLSLNDELLNGEFETEEYSFYGKYKIHLNQNQLYQFSKSTHISMLKNDMTNHITEIHHSYDEEKKLNIESFNMLSNHFYHMNQSSLEISNKLDFTKFHIDQMTPWFNQFSIGAKGLSGDGYSGHIFWDTEIFMLPYFIWTHPNIVKKCLLYRYERLEHNKILAESRGYKGAMVPWESAYSGFDQTPEFSAINIHTGKQTKIYSGLKEIHVTIDLMYMILIYGQATLDSDFMNRYGKPMLEAYATFWLSRVTKTSRGYEILDVIGPDEYTEHIDNNYYTNYMVYKVLSHSIKWIDDNTTIDLINEVCEHMYFPKERNFILPQDDSFLSKKIIDIKAYRKLPGHQNILKDYSREEVNQMQVLKQADTILLFELFPNDFSKNVIKNTFEYYESKTIHDSSLSKATHAIVAFDQDINHFKEVYFLDALDIDFSEESFSKKGIHAAAMFRPIYILWRGILGLTIDLDGRISMNPKVQNTIESFSINLKIKNRSISISYSMEKVVLKLVLGDSMDLWIGNECVNLKSEIVYINGKNGYVLFGCK